MEQGLETDFYAACGGLSKKGRAACFSPVFNKQGDVLVQFTIDTKPEQRVVAITPGCLHGEGIVEPKIVSSFRVGAVCAIAGQDVVSSKETIKAAACFAMGLVVMTRFLPRQYARTLWGVYPIPNRSLI